MATLARRFTTRRTDVVVESVGSDLLIFDRQTDTAHCLAEAAALVWRSCETGATLSDLAEMLVAHKLAGSPEDATALAEAALSELDEKGLLEASQPAGMPRRQAIGRIAGVGALAFSAPLIVSATASAACESTYGASCLNNSLGCCSADHLSCVSGTCCGSTSYACSTTSATCCSGYSCFNTSNSSDYHGKSGTCASSTCKTSGSCSSGECCVGFYCHNGSCTSVSS